MLKLGRVNKVKVLFLVLAFVFNFDLYKFSAAILEKGLLFSEQEGKTDDIQELRNKIMEVLRQEPYMGKKIPVR